jgi:TolA-binding protein
MIRGLSLILAGFLITLFVGCSSVSKAPSSGGTAGTETSKDTTSVSSSEISDESLVDELRQVRADYRRILEVMNRWYLDKGWHEKSTWTMRELSDLKKVRTGGSGKGSVALGEIKDSEKSSLKSIDIQNFSEVDWVEQLQQVRANYRRILEMLSGTHPWAAKELSDLRYVRQYPYLVVVDIQQTDLTPKDSIVEADQLYDEAVSLFKGAKFLPFINNKKKLKLALDKFNQLIKQYPTSDKIDDAAFYAGEISKEYFNDDVQAVKYYEMALKWNPKTPHPARFQAAVIYDFRMHDRSRAMALYQRVLTEEDDLIESNTQFSAVRLTQLLKEDQKDKDTSERTASPTESPVEK